MVSGFLYHRNRLAVVAGAIAPLVVAAVLVPFRATFASTAAALVMVIVIVAVAVSGPRIAGVVASASAALWFDFFLTRPYERFAISHRFDLETTLAIFVVGVLVTELAGRSRQHWRAANTSTAYVEMIHCVAVLAADSAPLDEMVSHTADSLTRLLSLRACRFDKTLSEPPLAQIQSNGDVALVGIRWPAKEIGLPGPEAEIVATWRGRAVGRFVLTPTPGATVTMEQRIVSVALVDVFAAYLVGERHAT
jgi:K+-sensing histidine kinase KdpD